MNTWLYQMTEERWPREEVLRAVKENRRLKWQHRRIVGESTPSDGDALVLFYAYWGANAPGICGTGLIEDLDTKRKEVVFTVVSPTNKLRENPWWDESVKEIVDGIRGRMPRATLFQIPKEQLKPMRSGITKWLR